MSFDYNEARATALELITEFGGTGEFIKTGDTGGYDEYGDPIAATPDIVISDTVTPLLPFKIGDIAGSNGTIVQADKYCFFHSDTAPGIGYTHTQNGVEWRVVSILSEITSVDGVNVFRRLQLRR